MSRLLPALVLLSLLLAPAASHAGKSYDNCSGFIDAVPAVITTQGVWCLRADLSTAIMTGSAIEVATNNVTIDCNDFKLGGLAAGDNTQAVGISVLSRSNATVTNCNIRGFLFGIYLQDGYGHRALSNVFDGNTRLGIVMGSFGSTIRGNVLTDTGGSTFNPFVAAGIAAAAGVDVMDNTINQVRTNADGSEAIGIWVFGGGSNTVSGNRVRNVIASGTGSLAYGIYTIGDSTMIRDNLLLGDNTGYGIACTNNSSTASGNSLARFPNPVVNCQENGNIINPN